MRLSIKLFLLCNQGYFKPKGSTNCEKKITCLRSKLAEYKSTKVSEFFANINLHHNVQNLQNGLQRNSPKQVFNPYNLKISQLQRSFGNQKFFRCKRVFCRGKSPVNKN